MAGPPVDLNNPPFFFIPRVPTVHHTMDGIRIDTHASALDRNGNHVPGLFAAGEVAGGIHGTNRLGVNAITDILVFGRIAGESAARNGADHPNPDTWVER